MITIGCDPEFFFTKDGKIVGAERVLPENGIKSKKSTIIIDGVQAELNPTPHIERADLGNEIADCFRKLRATMLMNKVKIDFSTTVTVDEKELESLSDKAKQFGCAPSKSASGAKAMTIKDASKYLYRSAGGHLHLGNYANNVEVQAVLDNPEYLVPILDIIVGNTCVLLDRSEGNIERRKVYGRAGEYRTPPHGVEYRTLSNFWLQSYQLMDLVTGLARQSIQICADGYAEKIRGAVNMDEVVKAINENDFDLAKSNFMKVLPILLEITPKANIFPIHKGNVTEFGHFIDKGIEYWFGNDPMKNWVSLRRGKEVGFGEYLSTSVNKDMNYGIN